MPTTNPKLSPYDTGLRCEAKVWLPYGTKVNEATPVANFGKVDFDNDTNETVCVAYVEKNPDGTHTVHVESMCEVGQVTVELHAGN